jgi:hypothetical protein
MKRRSFLGAIAAALCSPLAWIKGTPAKPVGTTKEPLAPIPLRRIQCSGCGALVQSGDWVHIEQLQREYDGGNGMATYLPGVKSVYCQKCWQVGDFISIL